MLKYLDQLSSKNTGINQARNLVESMMQHLCKQFDINVLHISLQMHYRIIYLWFSFMAAETPPK